MTIYCWDGEHLVADKAEYKYGLVVNASADKVYQFTSLYGATIYFVGAGLVTTIQELADTFAFKLRDPSVYGEDKLILKHKFCCRLREKEDLDVLVIEIPPGGDKPARGYYYAPNGYLREVKPPYAGGNESACLVSMGAMYAGAIAEEACKIALTLTNIGSADAVDVYRT